MASVPDDVANVVVADAVADADAQADVVGGAVDVAVASTDTDAVADDVAVTDGAVTDVVAAVASTEQQLTSPLASCETCGLSHAKHRCSRCRLVWYCSQKCQRQHWREHKASCHSLSFMRIKQGAFNESVSRVPDNLSATDVPVDDCAICLSVLKHPVRIDACSHVFCFACLQRYQSLQGAASSCPLCRAAIQDVEQDALSKAMLLSSRAGAMEEGSPERLEAGVLALEQFERLLTSGPDESRFWMAAMFGKAQLLIIQTDYVGSLSTINTMLDISPDNKDIPGLLLLKASCLMAQQDWMGANVSIHTALHHNSVRQPVRDRQLFADATRCRFELGDYATAISIGEGACLEMNRHYKGSSTYVAMSYKMSGNLEEAVATMRRALAYETPWDSENVEVVRNELRQLVAELVDRTAISDKLKSCAIEH